VTCPTHGAATAWCCVERPRRLAELPRTCGRAWTSRSGDGHARRRMCPPRRRSPSLRARAGAHDQVSEARVSTSHDVYVASARVCDCAVQAQTSSGALEDHGLVCRLLVVMIRSSKEVWMAVAVAMMMACAASGKRRACRARAHTNTKKTGRCVRASDVARARTHFPRIARCGPRRRGATPCY
jgi:hypothetical protein